MNKLTMPSRIARLTLLAVAGLALTFAMGITTMGTLIVYCGLLHMYSDSLKGCRALMGKRIALQFIGVPITVLVHNLLLLIPGLPTKLRLCMGVAIALPLLLTLNYRLHLGFSEVSQHVIVALITITFDKNPTYFVWRLALTTLGVVIGYLTYKYVFPLRNDLAYEEKRAELLELLEQISRGDPPVDAFSSGKALAEEARRQLEIVCEDVEIKKPYAPYRDKTQRLLWEQATSERFLEMYALLAEGEDCSGEYLESCTRTVEGYWLEFEAIRQGKETLTSQWDKACLEGVESAGDLHLCCCLERLREQLFANQPLLDREYA